MCGIVGYIGAHEASPLLIEGLKRLEYRGYDSAGVAVQNGTVSGRRTALELPVVASTRTNSQGGVERALRAPD